MADHVRNQIREAAAAALTGLATTGANVFQSRVYPLQDAELPGLRIYTDEESIEYDDAGIDNVLERTLSLVVEACAKANTDLDDTLDLILKEVEIALAGAQTLGGLCKYVELESIANELSGEGEKVTGVGRFTFRVAYYTKQSTPDIAL